jgi:hypothetical protein
MKSTGVGVRRMRRRGVRFGCVAAVIVAAGAVGLVRAQAASAGVLASGQTSTAGASVLVYLIPETYGSSVTFPLVASTTSDSSGNWSVSITNGSAEQAAETANAAEGGFAAFNVVTQSPTGQVTLDQIERVPNGTAAWTDVGGGSAAALSEDYATGTFTTITGAQPQESCVGTQTKQSGDWSTMAEVHAAKDMVTGKGDSGTYYSYDESNHADSHVHWMFSPDGSGWTSQTYDHITGTTDSSGGTIPFGPKTSTHVQGTFTYVRTIYGGICSYLGHQIHAKYWDGGLRFSSPITGVDGNCNLSSNRTIDLTPGQSRFKSSGQDAAYSSAATAFNVVGFAHYAGWSSNAQSHWLAGSAQSDHYLCGNDDVFTQSSKVYAG